MNVCMYYIQSIWVKFLNGTTFNVSGHENFKIWAQEDRVSELEYAAKIGPKVVEYYEKLFDFPFPLNKMDMVAIPDFQVQ